MYHQKTTVSCLIRKLLQTTYIPYSVGSEIITYWVSCQYGDLKVNNIQFGAGDDDSSNINQ